MDIMLDLETLGTKPGCVVLSIGAKVFDPYGDNTLPNPPAPQFYRNIDLFSSLMLGLTMDPKTVEWWRSKSEAAQGAFFPGQVTPRAAVVQFAEWFRPFNTPLIVWAKSPGFDCHVLEHLSEVAGAPLELNFRSFRDVRTAIGMSGIDEHSITAEGTGRTQHNALDDCDVQILQVQAAYRRLKPVQPEVMAPVQAGVGAPPPPMGVSGLKVTNG